MVTYRLTIRFLFEGNSASGSGRNGCDPDTQALFLFRGVTANAAKCSLSEIMQNKEWRDLVNVMRCGVGPKFDLSKLYYDRINIFTDADIDGSGIAAGMLAFFYYHCRPIIEAGKLYRVYTPLYRLDDKDHPFVSNKSEKVELYHKKLVKNFKIKIGSHTLSKDEFYDFLIDTYEYRESLIRAASESGNINKFLIESIIANLILMGYVRDEHDFDNMEELFSNQKFIKNMTSKIQKKFKEVYIDNQGRFSGVVDGKGVIVKVGNRFFKKTSNLMPIFKQYGYEIEVTEKDSESRVMSIGEFLDMATKFEPGVLSRFKGIGELNYDQLRDSAMDINHRVSVQFTIEDVERELGIFNTTHGGSKKDALARKNLIKHYKIKRDDLDN